MYSDFVSNIYLLYDNSDGKWITVRLSGESGWSEMFDEFRHFLNGIGYSVPVGSWFEDDDGEVAEDRLDDPWFKNEDDS